MLLSHIQGQILLSDPSPLTNNNVFSLIFQEKTQSEVVSAPSSLNFNNMTFLVNSPNKFLASNSNQHSKKERSKYVHCGILGQTTGKCYKLVGYPPNYSFKKKRLVSCF